MSKVRVLVGTRKGAFILTSDGKREKWDGQRPALCRLGDLSPEGIAGRSRTASTPRNRAAGSGRSFSAPTMAARPGTSRERPRRSDPTPDGPPKGESNKFVYDTSAETGQAAHHASVVRRHAASRGSSSGCGIWSRRSPIPTRFTPAWKTRRFSARPMADRVGTNSPGCAATAPDPSGSRARAACACTPSFSIPAIRSECSIAISAAGAFRTDDGGKTWKPINQGLHSQYIPDPNAEVGHCVHHIAMNPSRPGVLFMQKHWDVMRSDNAGDNWREVSGNLPTDFGFVIDVHAHEPETIYVVPIKSDWRALSARWQAARVPQPHRRQRVGAADQGAAAKRLLRERAARCHGGGFAGSVRRVFRHHRRAGVCLAPMPAIVGLRSCGIFRRCCRSRCRRCHDPRRFAAASANAGARRTAK